MSYCLLFVYISLVAAAAIVVGDSEVFGGVKHEVAQMDELIFVGHESNIGWLELAETVCAVDMKSTIGLTANLIEAGMPFYANVHVVTSDICVLIS